MSRSTTKRYIIPTTIGSHATVSSATLITLDVENFKQFDIVIRCSSSSGFNYDVKTAPVRDASLLTSQTGGHFVESVCSTVRHSFINNNINWLVITGSATATVSGSNVDVILTSIERD
jgi:hypothetical protein